jgi:hopene-associated glycosyltransferase HpnB
MESILSISGIVAVFALASWIHLLLFRGGFWKVWRFEYGAPQLKPPTEWPRVVAIVPARNEAETIGQTVASLVHQTYPGELSVLVVDDQSDDGTAMVAQRTARESGSPIRVRVEGTSCLPAGWTGKVWAMREGAHWSSAEQPAYYWFTDADVVHAPDTLRRLVTRAGQEDLDLASLMVLLHAQTGAERLLIPAFLFFFLKLYPPKWIAERKARTAGAAGGCILLRRAALERIGGLESIRREVIDDCALAARVKGTGGRIWMGLTRASVSSRVYGRAAEIRDMIARTAFTQLRYSALLLLASLAGMAMIYLAPVGLAVLSHGVARWVALGAWLLMTACYVPTVRFYRLSLFWALLLPVAALFYCCATCLSAVRYWMGRGGQWKGRVQAGPRAD